MGRSNYLLPILIRGIDNVNKLLALQSSEEVGTRGIGDRELGQELQPIWTQSRGGNEDWSEELEVVRGQQRPNVAGAAATEPAAAGTGVEGLLMGPVNSEHRDFEGRVSWLKPAKWFQSEGLIVSY